MCFLSFLLTAKTKQQNVLVCMQTAAFLSSAMFSIQQKICAARSSVHSVQLGIFLGGDQIRRGTSSCVSSENVDCEDILPRSYISKILGKEIV